MKHIKKHPINDKSQKLSKDMKKQELVKPKTDKVLDADKSLSDPKISKRVVKPSNKKLSSEKHLAGKKAKKVNENAEVDISGLKCDNPTCNYNDPSVPFSDYEQSINKPCPDCGESLLTQSDYDQVMQMVKAVELMNTYSQEDLDKMAAGLSEEDIDKALDVMNKLKLKKTGEDEDGMETWSGSLGKDIRNESRRNLKKFNEFLDPMGKWSKEEETESKECYNCMCCLDNEPTIETDENGDGPESIGCVKCPECGCNN